MVVRKKWRYVSNAKKCEDGTLMYKTIDFDGWWLFGIIPLYLVVLDKATRFSDGYCLRETVYKKYGKDANEKKEVRE